MPSVFVGCLPVLDLEVKSSKLNYPPGCLTLGFIGVRVDLIQYLMAELSVLTKKLCPKRRCLIWETKWMTANNSHLVMQ